MVFQKGNQLAKLRKNIVGFKKGNQYGKLNINKKRLDVSLRYKNNNPMKNPNIAKKQLESRRNNNKPWHTEESKRKISNSEKGKIISKETLKKISGANHCFFGKKRPEHSKRMKGKNNPSWNGGTSFEPYTPSFNRELKKLIKQRDKNKCFLCNRKKDLCIHHIDYNKKNCNPDNLITLCRSCNSKVNVKRKYWENYLK